VAGVAALDEKIDGGLRLAGRHGAVVLSLVLVAASPILLAQPSGLKQNAPTISTKNSMVLAEPPGSPLNMPSDAAVGRDGMLYVLDGVNNRVIAYNAEGQVQFQFGSRGGKLGQLVFPLGIATDPNGTVYVADSGNHRVQIFAPNGKPLEAINLPSVPSEVPPDPTDVAVDPTRKRIYIADNDNHHIVVYNMVSGRFDAVWGGPGMGERQFRFPFLMDISSQGYLFIVEPINTRVQVLNPAGKFVSFIGGWGIRPGQLFRPKGVATYDDRVYVTDSYLGKIQVFDVGGGFLGVLADKTGAPMKLITPTGITVDAKRKRLYIVELKANEVCRVDLE
jgi:DNA-binding beta-propeller fold protein YncE